MKVWLTFVSDGYDVYQLVGVYDNEEAAELHSEAVNEANKRFDGTPGVDFGEVDVWEVCSAYIPPPLHPR